MTSVTTHFYKRNQQRKTLFCLSYCLK